MRDADTRHRDGSVLVSPSFGGLVVTLLFWWESLTPTLIPRPWMTQATVSAVCSAIGYGIGTLVWFGAVRVLDRSGRGPSQSTRRRAWLALAAGWLVGIGYGSVRWLGWQNDQRELMGMSTVSWAAAVAVVLVAMLGAVLLVVAARAIVRGVRLLVDVGRRTLPTGLSDPPTILVGLGLVVVLLGWAAFGGLTMLATWHYGSVNDETEAGIVQPQAPSVSGSSESLVSWDSLGRTGREFVAGVTTEEELSRFDGAGSDPVDPVRAYVGVESAATVGARADLAVQELDRAGGFDREVLVVWVPTGSGWMINEAADAIETMYDGDTAIVGIQSSYLPSLLSVFMKRGLANEAGAALFSAVEAHWRQLPPEDRPKLLVFGKSLGTAGVEAPFAASDAASSLANLVARTDGALIVGAKYSNPILAQVTQTRDPDSPVWQPVFDDGRTVRFATLDPVEPDLDPVWRSPRIVYLQHPSDPVPYWGPSALWKSPEWMDRPRGYDVPDAAHWFPVVTAVQALSDQLHQLSPPPGFGHDYATEYVEGWALVAPPDGWTDADTDRLEELLAHGSSGEQES